MRQYGLLCHLWCCLDMGQIFFLSMTTSIQLYQLPSHVHDAVIIAIMCLSICIFPSAGEPDINRKYIQFLSGHNGAGVMISASQSYMKHTFHCQTRNTNVSSQWYAVDVMSQCFWWQKICKNVVHPKLTWMFSNPFLEIQLRFKSFH